MRAAALFVLVLMSACKAEPSFDERYARTQQRLEARAAEIDRQVASGAASDAAPAAPVK